MTTLPVRWFFALLLVWMLLCNYGVQAATITSKSIVATPANRLARLLAKAHWRTLQTTFFCYQKSPLLAHGFASGGRLMLTHHSMRYQIDWPIPAVYLLYHKRLYGKVTGKPWQKLSSAHKPRMATAIKYLARLGQSADGYVRIGDVSLLNVSMPLPPQRDRHYVPPSKAIIIGFGVVPKSKRLRHFVLQIDLFVNSRTGLLRGLKIFSRQGTVTYWFYNARKDIKLSSVVFRPVGGA